MSQFGVTRRFASYRKEEDGSLTIFSLFLFILILLIAGTAVDLVYHEQQRAKLQNTLDTAVLAAASATQDADAEQVMRSYVENAGFDPDFVTFGTSDQGGERTASAVSTLGTSTLFMGMMGIDQLNSTSGASAAEVVTSIEISLVLDFTSSMRGARRETLVEAVKDFINVVYELDCDSNGDNCVAPSDPKDITVNVVPYGGTVNPGPQMAAMMGLQRWHTYSSCGVLPTNAYDNTALPYGSTQQYPHYYIWWRQVPTMQQEFGWCPQDSNTILYAQNDPEAIKTYVANLNLNDGTGTDIGMKWGMALLDPTSRDEVNAVTGNPTGVFPRDSSPSVMKVAVLMTDGGITAQKLPTEFAFNHLYDENGDLRAPNLANDDPNLDPSIPFFTQRETIFDRRGSEDIEGEPRDRSIVEVEEPGGAAARTGSEFVLQSEAIANLESQCALAKTNVPGPSGMKDAVTVYSVRLLEDRQWTEDYMKPCASSDSFYFDVQTLGALDNAFTSIAEHISNQALSLTN